MFADMFLTDDVNIKKQENVSPRFLSVPPIGRKKILIPPKQRCLKIYFSPAERQGEDYRVKKITKIKSTRALVGRFNEFRHLWSLYIFGFCFVVP